MERTLPAFATGATRSLRSDFVGRAIQAGERMVAAGNLADIATGIMADEGTAEARLGPVGTGTVDQAAVEEERVAGLHLDQLRLQAFRHRHEMRRVAFTAVGRIGADDRGVVRLRHDVHGAVFGVTVIDRGPGRDAGARFDEEIKLDDIKKEYDILLKEVFLFNPDLLDKPRLLVITKADIMDEELKNMLLSELPKDIQPTFISAVTGYGITELKDKIWPLLQRD